MNYRNVLLFVVALIICVPVLAFAAKPTKPTYVTQEAFDTEVTARVDGDAGLQGQINAIGVTPWTDDGYGTLWTTDSIQIGDGGDLCDSTTAGTIRFTGTDFEGCDGTAWVSLDASGSSGAFACGVDQVQDADGNWYDTVQIGSQCWMAKNLNVGTRIHTVTEQTENGTTEKHCYDNNDANCDTDGGLYEWDEMMQYANNGMAQGLCPAGWHIPTDEEWKTLEMALGMSQFNADTFGWRGWSGEGYKLIQGYTSGFEALYAGFLSGFVYTGRETSARFWTSTGKINPQEEADGLPGTAVVRGLQYNTGKIMREWHLKQASYSVRCEKN